MENLEEIIFYTDIFVNETEEDWSSNTLVKLREFVQAGGILTFSDIVMKCKLLEFGWECKVPVQSVEKRTNKTGGIYEWFYLMHMIDEKPVHISCEMSLLRDMIIKQAQKLFQIQK